MLLQAQGLIISCLISNKLSPVVWGFFASAAYYTRAKFQDLLHRAEVRDRDTQKPLYAPLEVVVPRLRPHKWLLF